MAQKYHLPVLFKLIYQNIEAYLSTGTSFNRSLRLAVQNAEEHLVASYAS